MTPDPFDTEFGAGVRTVRHAPAAAGPWIDAPTCDGLWWARSPQGSAVVIDAYRSDGAWEFAAMGTDRAGELALDRGFKFAPAIPPAAPTDDAPATHFDEPPEIP